MGDLSAGRIHPQAARRPRTRSLAVALIAGAALLAVAPAGAAAAPCGDDGAGETTMFDPGGYLFDIGEASAPTADRFDTFATLHDGGAHPPSALPPGPRGNADAYDDWGALFVGGTGNEDTYYSADNDSCVREEGGAEQVFPEVEVNKLIVQRKIYVPPAGAPNALPGARILNLITNPTEFFIDTSVQVGDYQSPSDRGDLGSDRLTAVRSSSSGDLAATPADDWFVTSDHAGVTANDDPALAHVIDGPGGDDSVSFVTLTGINGIDLKPADNLAYAWEGLKLDPGETAAFMSWEAQADTASGDAAAGDALARSMAEQIENASPEQLYAGMSDDEIHALRNWDDYDIGASLHSRRQPLAKRLKLKAKCAAGPCRVLVSGSVDVGARSFPLAQRTHRVGSGKKLKLKLGFANPGALRQIERKIAGKPSLAKDVVAHFSGLASHVAGVGSDPLQARAKLEVPKP